MRTHPAALYRCSERQVSVLRERNMDMRHRLNNLLDTARTNDRLFEQTKQLVLHLLEAQTLDQIVDTFVNSLQKILKWILPAW